MKKMHPQTKKNMPAYIVMTIFIFIICRFILKMVLSISHDMNQENELRTNRQLNELYEWDYKQKHKDD